MSFLFLGNHLAVDFVNTEVMEGDERVDKLSCDRAVLSWARAAGLRVARGAMAAANGEDLALEVYAFRQAARRLLEAAIENTRPRPADLRMLNRRLQASGARPTVGFADGRFQRNAPVLRSVSCVLALVAEALAQVLAGDDAKRLGRCANHRCVLLFVDNSRAGARRWCAMEICGNRAKVSAHYRRKRSTS